MVASIVIRWYLLVLFNNSLNLSCWISCLSSKPGYGLPSLGCWHVGWWRRSSVVWWSETTCFLSTGCIQWGTGELGQIILGILEFFWGNLKMLVLPNFCEDFFGVWWIEFMSGLFCWTFPFSSPKHLKIHYWFGFLPKWSRFSSPLRKKWFSLRFIYHPFSQPPHDKFTLGVP